MALEISGYVDPGVYTAERVVPGSVSLSTVPNTVCLIGAGDRTKRAINETKLRGEITLETLTVSSTVSAHDATLAQRSNRKSAQATLYRDDVELPRNSFTFRPATVTGLTLTTLDLTTNNKISLSMDGKQFITIAITSGGADLTTITGSLVTQRLLSIGAIAAVTPAQIAEGINKALAGATSLGYGSAYGAVATVDTNRVVVTSPDLTNSSDVKFVASFPTAQDRTDEVFGVMPISAASVIRIDNLYYGVASVYKLTYISVANDTDTLLNADVQTIVRVGAFPGVTTFTEGTDFNRSGSTLDWSPDAAASFTSSIAAATYDISTNDTVIVALDGRAAVTIDLNGLASPPPGYANPASPAAATGAEIIANINAVLANTYGPQYGSVATFASTRFTLTSPTQGVASYVQIAAPTSLSAVLALFGLQTAQLPYTAAGIGSRPVAGTAYYVTYTYTRLSADYNIAKRFFSPDSMYADIGFPSSSNKLAIAGSIAFENGAPSVMVVQVNDSTFPSSPTQAEFLAAMNAAALTSVATDIVVLSTNLAVQVDLLNHVVNMNGPIEQNYRRGWFGMARGTAIGDRDTADTFVYRAVRTLQVPADSPGRGRLLLVAPGSVSRSVVLESGAAETVLLDGTFAAAAVAARMTAFTSPADTLLRKTVSGLRIEDFPTYVKAERAQLASNGVTVITQDAGRLILLDPVTTEAGGGRLPQFVEPSASTQKDAVSLAVNELVDANLVGVVPDDLSRFLTTVKSYVGSALQALIASGAIAPFRDDSGVSRDIDLSRDVQAFQDATDPTKYYFRYTYFLRYPAKRFFGEYSVDRPFF